MKQKPAPVRLEMSAAEKAIERLRVQIALPIEPRRLRGVAYFRYSTTIQDEPSIDRQRINVAGHCARHHIDLVAEFADRAESGTREDRPKLTQALDFILSGGADVLVVEDVDRIARDVLLFVKIWHTLRKAKKLLHTVKDGLLDNALLSVMRGAMAAEELQKTRDRSSENVRMAVEKGSVFGVAYGYAKVPGVPGRRVIVEEQMKVYDQICEMYLDGLTYVAIAKYLNDEGVPPPGRASRWLVNSIRQILHNPIYSGVYLHARNTSAKKTTSTTIEVNHPELARDPDRWRRVQEEAARRFRRHVANDWSNDLLKNVLLCSGCGEPMTRASDRRRDRRAYHCFRQPSCDGRIKSGLVQDAVLSVLSEILDNGQWRELFDAYRRRHISSATDGIRRELAQKRALKAQIEEALVDSGLEGWRPDLDKESRAVVRAALPQRRKAVADRIAVLEADLRVFEKDEALLDGFDDRLKQLAQGGFSGQATRASISVMAQIKRVLPHITFRRLPGLYAVELRMRFSVKAHEAHVGHDVAVLRRVVFHSGPREVGDPYFELVKREMARGRWAVTPDERVRLAAALPALGPDDLDRRIVGLMIHAQTGLACGNVERLLGMPVSSLCRTVTRVVRQSGVDGVRKAFDDVGSSALGTIPAGFRKGHRATYALAHLGPIEVEAGEAAVDPVRPARPRRARTGGRRPRGKSVDDKSATKPQADAAPGARSRKG